MGMQKTLLLVLLLEVLAPASASLLNQLGRHDNLKCPSQDAVDECYRRLDIAEKKGHNCVDYGDASTKINSTDQQTATAFTVELSSDRSLSNEAPLTFDKILEDSNDNFIPLLGAFRCPDDDIYAFYWTIIALEGRAAAALVKQGQLYKYGPLTREISSSFSGTSSMSSLLQCTEGDMIWLKAETWPDERACNELEGLYSSFTGVKVFRESDSEAIGFTAELSSNTTGSPVIYDNVTFSVGSGYDKDTGEFVCLSDGIYVFSISAHSADSTYTFYLRKNGVELPLRMRTMNSESNSFDTGTSVLYLTVECEEDDIITVTSDSPSENLAKVSSFTGFCLHDPADDIIAFTAKLTSESRDYLDGMTVVFDEIITNIGGRYFPQLGIFICPDDYLYMFFWSVRCYLESDQRACELRLVMSGDAETEELKVGPKTSDVLSGNASGSTSTQAVVRCEEDKAIYIKAIVTGGVAQTYGAVYTSFSGFRIPTL